VAESATRYGVYGSISRLCSVAYGFAGRSWYNKCFVGDDASRCHVLSCIVRCFELVEYAYLVSVGWLSGNPHRNQFLGFFNVRRWELPLVGTVWVGCGDGVRRHAHVDQLVVDVDARILNMLGLTIVLVAGCILGALFKGVGGG
jgi:hypothetical protein